VTAWFLDMFGNFYLVKNHKPLKVEKEWNSALYKNVNNCLNNIYPNIERHIVVRVLIYI